MSSFKFSHRQIDRHTHKEKYRKRGARSDTQNHLLLNISSQTPW